MSNVTINLNLSGGRNLISQLRQYQDPTPEPVAEFELMRGFTNAHPFKDRKLKPKQKKQCTKGHQCGFSCVAATKVCLADMTTEQFKAHNAAKRAERKAKRQAAKAVAAGGGGGKAQQLQDALIAKDYETLTKVGDQVYQDSRKLAQSQGGDFYAGIAEGNGSENDWILSSLYKERGFDGLPEQITASQFKQFAAAGEVAMYRAMGSSDARFQQHFDRFKSGDYYAGHGIYGHGTYVAWADGQSTTDREFEEGFIRRLASNATAGYGSKMMRMTIKSDAAIANQSEISLKMAQDKSDFDRWARNTSATITDPAQKKEFRAQVRRTKAVLFGDGEYGGHSGRYAVVRGIDAVKLDEAYDPTYMLLLNRSAVRVVKTASKSGTI